MSEQTVLPGPTNTFNGVHTFDGLPPALYCRDQYDGMASARSREPLTRAVSRALLESLAACKDAVVGIRQRLAMGSSPGCPQAGRRVRPAGSGDVLGVAHAVGTWSRPGGAQG